LAEVNPSRGRKASQSILIERSQLGADCRNIKRMINDRMSTATSLVACSCFTPEIHDEQGIMKIRFHCLQGPSLATLRRKMRPRVSQLQAIALPIKGISLSCT
jgi:hypothetical protein